MGATMNARYFSLLLVLVLCAAGSTLRAAGEPHADGEANRTWTNEDLERLGRNPGLISIVGPVENEDVQQVDAPATQPTTQDQVWYAEQAASLTARLEREQANLHAFTQALQDARELNSTTSGVNLVQYDIGITPAATIDILQNRIRETQGELDALADLARRDSIPPGILRGQ